MIREEYGEEFYKRAIEQEGVDYNYYGDWQRNYAKMVIDICEVIQYAANNQDAIMLDVGAACGVTLRGFKETKVFGKCVGVDRSEYLVTIGRERHGFADDELIVMDITEEPLPFEDNSIAFLHCSHVMEHILDENLSVTFQEMHRVLIPEDGYGLFVIPAVKPGNPISEVAREKSHYSIQTQTWWRKRIVDAGFILDNDVRKRFKDSPFSPVNNKESTFYDNYNKGWTLFGVRKEK